MFFSVLSPRIHIQLMDSWTTHFAFGRLPGMKHIFFLARTTKWKEKWTNRQRKSETFSRRVFFSPFPTNITLYHCIVYSRLIFSRCTLSVNIVLLYRHVFDWFSTWLSLQKETYLFFANKKNKLVYQEKIYYFVLSGLEYWGKNRPPSSPASS